MVSAGIFGPKLSGKTTLARELSKHHWACCRMRTLCLDPHQEQWGKQALVFGSDEPGAQELEEEKFWSSVWRSQDCLVIVEESASTIRRDRTLVPVFTRLRHRRHRLIVVGHSGIDLLPVMRQQLDTIYLFRQPRKAADIWVENFCDERLLECMDLGQFEFIFHRMYGEPRRMRLPGPNGPDVQRPK